MGQLKILPGNIANMIAAGEVVQRPASVVKELMENALDAGADKVDVTVVDAGRTLIRVIDNGSGMTPDDAVLCFERHATSKIAEAEDLTRILTFGFRGEALASIAAVAEVTLKTRREDAELGVEVEFAASEHLATREVAAPKGTNVSVRNLFYNIPARRKFLKSDNVELRHVTDEFIRVALTRPDMEFSLRSGNRDIHLLKKAKSLKFRIADLLGQGIAADLVDISADTSIARISGFVGRPDTAKKTLGNQFFFVNGRFFRSPYLHKAVMKAYENLIPEGVTPSYFIYLEVDPASMDVNIHPTKTEIKFSDDTILFQTVYAAVRESIGRGAFAATLDFDNPEAKDLPIVGKEFRDWTPEPHVSLDPSYNPFEQSAPKLDGAELDFGPHGYSYKKPTDDYGVLFEKPAGQTQTVLTLGGRFIAEQTASGLSIVHVRRARERLLYDSFAAALGSSVPVGRVSLFPVQVTVGRSGVDLVEANQELLASLSFDIAPFGPDSIVVNAVPEGFPSTAEDVEKLIAEVLEALSDEAVNVGDMLRDSLARSLARIAASGSAAPLTQTEAAALLDRLHSSSAPDFTPSGKRIVYRLSMDDIEKLF